MNRLSSKNKNAQVGPNALIVLVTGVSGAGLTTAMNALNDSGFYCMDNLPVDMIIPTIISLDIAKNPNFRGFAFGVHLHGLKSVEYFVSVYQEIKSKGQADLLFLTATNKVLMDRYSTTRRPHPLLRKGGNFQRVITEEKGILQPVQRIADMVVETSDLSHHELVLKMETRYLGQIPGRVLNVSIISFGFKYGQMQPLDSMYDARFLKNPYFVPELKQMNGLSEEVSSYIMAHEDSKVFLSRLIDWHTWALPKYFAEGKHYFRLGVGCTGGKHRSVCVAEMLGKAVADLNRNTIVVNVGHRDINRDKPC